MADNAEPKQLKRGLSKPFSAGESGNARRNFLANIRTGNYSLREANYESIVNAAKTYSPAEISAVTGASVRAVYKAIGQRLPRAVSVHCGGRHHYLTRWGAVCFVIDREMPKDVPVMVRRQLYTTILQNQSVARVQHDCGILSYVIDVKAVADRVDNDLARYRAAMALIVEDETIQGGAATFRGTRILVHQIVNLLAQGADNAELREDYPRLTLAMLAAAPVYAQAHPRRGTPKVPSWRKIAVASGRGKPRGR